MKLPPFLFNGRGGERRNSSLCVHPCRQWKALSVILSGLMSIMASEAYSAITIEPSQIDFGMVPVGATEQKTINVCNPATDPQQTILLFKTPEGFRVEGTTPMLLHPGYCQKYTLEFTPKSTDTGLTRYGILLNEDKQVEMAEYLSRLVARVQQGDSDSPEKDELLGRLSGISLDPTEWVHRIPNIYNQPTYRYQGLIEDQSNGYRMIESQYGTLSNYILDNNESVFTLSSDYPNSLVTQFQWSEKKNSWIRLPKQFSAPENSCGLALHPAHRWLITGSRLDSTLTAHDTRGIEPKPVRASGLADHFIQFCNLLFDATGNTLFSLAFTSQYQGKQTKLIAMRFNASTGMLEDPTYEQLGSDTSVSTLSTLHAMSMDDQNRLAVHHMRSGSKLARRYQYSPENHRLELKEDISFDEDEPALRTIDQSRNGHYLLMNSEKAGEFKVKHQINHQWQTLIIDQWQPFTDTLNEEEYTPVDGRFAHLNDDFVITTREKNSLRLYAESSKGSRRWRCQQAFFEEEGLPMNTSPRKVMFSKDDRWITVMTEKAILFFQKMDCETVKRQFHWPHGKPEWWENYEQKACTASEVEATP